MKPKMVFLQNSTGFRALGLEVGDRWIPFRKKTKLMLKTDAWDWPNVLHLDLFAGIGTLEKTKKETRKLHFFGIIKETEQMILGTLQRFGYDSQFLQDSEGAFFPEGFQSKVLAKYSHSIETVAFKMLGKFVEKVEISFASDLQTEQMAEFRKRQLEILQMPNIEIEEKNPNGWPTYEVVARYSEEEFEEIRILIDITYNLSMCQNVHFQEGDPALGNTPVIGKVTIERNTYLVIPKTESWKKIGIDPIKFANKKLPVLISLKRGRKGMVALAEPIEQLSNNYLQLLEHSDGLQI